MNDLNLERKPLKIQSSKILEVFLDTHRVRLLEPFMQQPRSIPEAAQICGLNVKKMAYWVNKFQEYSLLVEVESARARQAALYTAQTTHFVVEDLDSLLVQEYTERQFGPLWKVFMADICADSRRYADMWDFHVLMDEQGSLVRDFAPAWERATYRYDPERVIGNGINTWAMLPLSRDDAHDLMSRLEQLLSEYVQKASASPDAQTFLVHLGLVRHTSSSTDFD